MVQLMAEILHRLICSLSHYLQGLNIPGGVGKNSRPRRALFQIQGLWKRCLVEECQADPQQDTSLDSLKGRSHLTLQKITWNLFIDSQLNGDFQPFPIYTVYIKIWFIIQLKQPFIRWFFGVPGTHVINVLVSFHSDPARA